MPKLPPAVAAQVAAAESWVVPHAAFARRDEVTQPVDQPSDPDLEAYADDLERRGQLESRVLYRGKPGCGCALVVVVDHPDGAFVRYRVGKSSWKACRPDEGQQLWTSCRHRTAAFDADEIARVVTEVSSASRPRPSPG